MKALFALSLALCALSCSRPEAPPPPVVADAGNGKVEETGRTLSALRTWIEERRKRGTPIPRTLDPADAERRSDIRDAWGKDIRIEPEIDAASGDVTAFTLRSAGPDGKFGTPDDLLDAPPENR